MEDCWRILSGNRDSGIFGLLIVTGLHFAIGRVMDDIVRCPNCGQANRLPTDPSKKAVCGACKTPLTGGHPIELTDANFAETISSGAFLVDFWAAWCGPCRMIAPVIEEMAASRTDVRFAKLNVDQNPRSAQTYRAMSIPLLVLFKDGVEKGRVVGAVPRTQIEAAIRQYLG
jgi:thioredoxin